MEKAAEETRIRAGVGTVLAQSGLGLTAGLAALIGGCIFLTGTLPSPLSMAIVLGLGAVSVWSTWRAATARLTFDDQTIRVRNFWRTHTFRWDEVFMIGWDHYTVWLPCPELAFDSRCVLFWIKPSSWPTVPVTVGAKATVAQPIEMKGLIVTRLAESAKRHGIQFRLSVLELSKGSGPIPFPNDPDDALTGGE